MSSNRDRTNTCSAKGSVISCSSGDPAPTPEKGPAMLRRQDWLLLFLGAEGGHLPTDQIRVMKGMFLLDRTDEHPAQGLYHFEAYDYGPFASAVYRDLDALQLQGLVHVTRHIGTSRKTYELTAAGREKFAELADSTEPDDLELVREAKQRVTSLGFEELLEQIYEEYPEYAEKSVARVRGAGVP